MDLFWGLWLICMAIAISWVVSFHYDSWKDKKAKENELKEIS